MKNQEKISHPFTPNPEQMALWPEISGNTINGLGEEKDRRPSPILWHDSDTLEHGAVQNWFWGQGSKEPELMAMRGRRQKVIDQASAPQASIQRTISPEEASQKIKQIALQSGAQLVGIVPTQAEWIFEGYEFDYPWIIVLGVVMDHEQLSTAPEVTAAYEVVDKYIQGWVAARPVADWILSQGWRAKASGGPMAGPVNIIPPALEAGFGELGKHGSIINREYGSSFRISAVFTDLPLQADTADAFGADEFCAQCQICTKACPVEAILDHKVIVRGKEKWYVDFDRCFPYFAETYGCGICIAVCPWSTPGRAPRMAEKMTRKFLADG